MRARLAFVLLFAFLMISGSAQAKKKRPATAEPTPPLARLIGEALTSDVGWERLVHLCDRIGHRLSGSPQLDKAIAWAQERMREDGLVEVRAEPVEVPAWIRGSASLDLIAPRPMSLDVLALGGSVATPEGGIEADVIVVDSLPDMASRDEADVAGHIVVYDLPFTSYRETVGIRTRGAAAAAKKGAVASLVRSVGPHSLQTPHTGNQGYEEGVPPIPAAAITMETSEMLRRLQERGTTPRLSLKLGCSMGPPAQSANVIGEIRGSEKPDEVVLVGCHLDSWDVGQGAQDDGAGCLAAMEAGRLIARLPEPPLRTVRVVLFTNEENGLAGGRTYAAEHADETHFAVLESDTGAGTPLGFRVDLRIPPTEPGGDAVRDEAAWPATLARLTPLRDALAPLAATDLTPGYAGADISPLVRMGAPGFGLSQDMSGYWPIHHTEADTIDKIDPVVFRQNVAVFTTAAWVLANMSDPPRP